MTGAAKADIAKERDLGNGNDDDDWQQQGLKTKTFSCSGNVFALDRQPFNGCPHCPENVNLLLAEVYEDYMAMQAETNGLKLIATEQLAEIFEQLEAKYREGFKLSQNFMNKIIELVVREDNNKIKEYQKELQEQWAATKATAEALMRQMRTELQEI